MSHDTTPQRVQRRRTKGFQLPPNTTSVCRPGKWGNPFRVLEEDGVFWIVDADGNYWREWYATKLDAVQKAVWMFEGWIEGKVESGQLDITELSGKNLACFCAVGTPCHADVLLKKANLLNALT